VDPGVGAAGGHRLGESSDMGKGLFQLALHGAQALPLPLEPSEVGPVVLGEEENAGAQA
jgi:hypothetical protein